MSMPITPQELYGFARFMVHAFVPVGAVVFGLGLAVGWFVRGRVKA